MFDRFGEFNSAEELNNAAEGLRDEGDRESLVELAKENGLDPEDAEDYMDGYADKLASPIMAAMGKIRLECEELKPEEIMEDWVDYIRMQCSARPEIAAAVRKKGKSVQGCIARLLTWSFRNAKTVPADICEDAGVKGGAVKLGIPGMGRAKQIINDYYLEEEE